jgi:TolB-like protein/DNA-binding winged helix-turn-helix (wHTH) protein/Tfp pilus assembly protein PilF
LIYRFGDFQVDDADFRLTSGSTPIALEPKVLRLLLYLVQNPGRLVRKQEILDAVWQEASVTENALTRSIGLLRRTLDDRSREPRYIETVPTVGYRFIAVVETSPVLAATEPSILTDRDLPEGPPDGPGDGGRAGEQMSRLLVRTFVVLACVALLGAGWAVRARLRRADAIHSLAVLPLENLSGDPGQEYFADGTTDELITELARIPNLRVVSRTSVMQEKGAGKSLQKIASELNVDAIVEGSIARSGDRVRITAQLVDTRSDRHLWAQSFEGPSSDILSLQDSVADQIAAEARVILVPHDQDQTHPVKPEAYDAYLRGRYFFQKDDFLQSADSFRKAISADPSYASAYAGLADAFDAETTFGMARPDEVMPQAMAAAQHAIALDPRNGEAYAALGSIQTIYLWDWREAERNLTRAIALSPSYALAEMKYAALLDAVGKPDDAVTHMRRAVSLDPLSFFMNRRLGSTLYLDRRYDEAYAQFQRAVELEPEHSHVADEYRSWIFELKGDRGQAVDYDLEMLHRTYPEMDTAALRTAYQTGGWNAFLAARIRTLQAYTDHLCMPYRVGVDYLELGDRDHAFEMLNRAVDQHCYWMSWTQADPRLDPVHNDPRFAQLLRRMNLPA